MISQMHVKRDKRLPRGDTEVFCFGFISPWLLRVATGEPWGRTIVEGWDCFQEFFPYRKQWRFLFLKDLFYQKLGLYLIFILHVGEHRGKWPPRGARGQGVAGARQPQPGALPGGEQACLGASVWMAFHLAFALTARALDKWCRPVQVKSILTFASGVTGL